ncbi:MAG: hypothetical protein NZM25_05670 [Leptospiraceae bacterium]|nr:hypothetical protein [Leptospiraceae bacterium]MDW8306535.1 hypothetical protein [Leptospiraceae bacterium]
MLARQGRRWYLAKIRELFLKISGNPRARELQEISFSLRLTVCHIPQKSRDYSHEARKIHG